MKRSKKLDHDYLIILSLIPRGWLILGLIGLAPAFVGGHCLYNLSGHKSVRRFAYLQSPFKTLSQSCATQQRLHCLEIHLSLSLRRRPILRNGGPHLGQNP